MFNRNLPTSTSRRNNRFDPWSSFQEEMRDLVSRFNEDWGEGLPSSTPTQFVPKVDLKDKGKEYLVTAEIPGMTEKDIDISLDENVLTLQGERRSEHKDEDKDKGFFRSEISYGSFYRTIPLNEEVDDNKVEANYKDGMLKITLPKKEGAQKKSKKISIGQGAGTKH
ncbi:MAG: Hsp20/alpha crystallin family protein [Bacteriovoracia bacterium]